jgi:flagellar biosynthesis protein FliR
MPAEMFDTLALFRLGSVAIRLSAMLVFLPLPGFRNLPPAARVLLALSLAIVLAAASLDSLSSSGVHEDLIMRLLADLFTGVSISLVATLVIESIMFGGQIIAVTAGFSYASMIDPFSESDSSILPSLMSLTANLLLFQSPLYAGLVRALSASVNQVPNQVSVRGPEAARILLRFSTHCLQTGIKLALPVIALVFLTDLCIGLFGRLQPQIQFLSISFSLKLLGTMAATAAVLPAVGWLYQGLAITAVDVLHALTR